MKSPQIYFKATSAFLFLLASACSGESISTPTQALLPGNKDSFTFDTLFSSQNAPADKIFSNDENGLFERPFLRPISASNGTLTTVADPQFGGAITSVTIASNPDHNFVYNGLGRRHAAGMSFQTSYQLNGLAECNNPTEGGNSSDVTSSSGSTTEILGAGNYGPNALVTRFKPAYWYNTKQAPWNVNNANYDCATPTKKGVADGVTPDVVTKGVTLLADPRFPNALHYFTSIFPGASYTSLDLMNSFWTTEDFDRGYTFNPKTKEIKDVSERARAQYGLAADLPVIMSNGSYALALIVPKKHRTAAIQHVIALQVDHGTKNASSMISPVFLDKAVKVNTRHDYTAYFIIGEPEKVVRQLEQIAPNLGW